MTHRSIQKLERDSIGAGREVGANGAQPVGHILNLAKDYSVFCLLLLNSVLVEGGNKTGDGKKGTIDVSALIESYVEEVGDIDDLLEDIREMHASVTRPRKWEKDHAPKPEDQTEP